MITRELYRCRLCPDRTSALYTPTDEAGTAKMQRHLKSKHRKVIDLTVKLPDAPEAQETPI